jgi:hypothetical protein
MEAHESKQTLQCARCKADFIGTVMDMGLALDGPSRAGQWLIKPSHCPSCLEVVTREEAEKAERFRCEQRLFEWVEICPPAYRGTKDGGPTVEARIEALPEWRELSEHRLGKVGLILRGRTGTYKSRAMFHLLRRYFFAEPKPSIVAVTSGEFDRQCRDAAGTFNLSSWFYSLESASIVFIDDLGKTKWTPATAGQFWELVDARTKKLRPIFITTNLSGETLIEHLGVAKDVAEPLLRRLRENCKVVVMKGEQTA